MNNPFSPEQTSRTGNNDANLLTRQYKLDSIARFLETKAMNPKLEQNELAKQLNHSNSTLQLYRNDIDIQKKPQN